MSDLISRQAAIDVIDMGRLGNPNEPRWSDNELVNFLESRPTCWQIYDVCPPEEPGTLVGTGRRMHWTDLDAGVGLFDNEVTAWMELPDPFEG